jgi:hypothetical protein
VSLLAKEGPGVEHGIILREVGDRCRIRKKTGIKQVSSYIVGGDGRKGNAIYLAGEVEAHLTRKKGLIAKLFNASSGFARDFRMEGFVSDSHRFARCLALDKQDGLNRRRVN